MSILEVKGLRKVYTTRFGGNQVEALRNVSFSVEQGEYVAVMGESGSGKTTLLNILAALDKPTAGSVVLDGRELSKVGDADAATFRRDNLGFVFQEFNLLDTFSLEDNIAPPVVSAVMEYLPLNTEFITVHQPVPTTLKAPPEAEQPALKVCSLGALGSLLLSPQPTQAKTSAQVSSRLRKTLSFFMVFCPFRFYLRFFILSKRAGQCLFVDCRQTLLFYINTFL